MKYVYREGYQIGVIQVGDKSQKPILIIGSALYYPRLFDKDIYKTLNLVFIDHRGFLKPEQENRYRLDAIVEDIEAVRIACQFNSFYILGHSGHGFMAMAYAQKYSEHVDGLILSNLAPTNSEERQKKSIAFFEKEASAERKTFFEKEIAKLPLDIEGDPKHRFSHMNIRMQAHSFYDYTYDGAYLWEGVYNNMEALDYLWGTAFAEFDTASFMRTFDKPILLLLGDYDFLVGPVDLWTPMTQSGHIQLHRFRQSGHNPMLEEPLEYCRVLESFIREDEADISITYAKKENLTSWMAMIDRVKHIFPGLETEERIATYKENVEKTINDNRAICALSGEQVVGILLFSTEDNMLSCMAVDPNFRRKHIAFRMFQLMLERMDRERPIVLETFRRDDERGIAPRAFYKTLGFEEGEECFFDDIDPVQRFYLRQW